MGWEFVDALMAVGRGGSRTHVLAALTPDLTAVGSALALRPEAETATWCVSYGAPPATEVARRAAELREPVVDGPCAAVPLMTAGEALGALAVRWETPALAAAHHRRLSAVGPRLAGALADAQVRAADRFTLSEAVGSLITTDEHGTIVFATAGAGALLGYQASALVGLPVEALVPERLRPALAQARESPPLDLAVMPLRLAFMARRQDELEIPVEVSITSTTRPARGYTIAIADTAVRGLESKLLETHKLESIGRLAAGVAHDFTNLLTSINGCAHLMLSRMTFADPSHEDARTIVRCTEEAGQLISQLQAFGRGERLEVQAIDLNRTLRDMARLLEVLLGEEVALELRLGQRLPPVEANLGALEQVVMQLGANARAAMPDGGSFVIETSTREAEGRRRVLLTVRDTGEGMDASTLQRAFEPFYTTKERAPGTGLGLSTVAGIVHRIGGQVTLTSTLGEGTVVRIDVPAATTTAARVSGPGSSATALTVMLVEDEELVRSIVTRILADEGYRLLVAASGDEALQLAEETPGRIDLLISDVVMAGLTGPELAARLRARRPGMKVLMVSGYAGMPLGTVDDFLPKPFNPFELVRRVRKLLRP